MSVEFHYGTSSCTGIRSTKYTRSKSLFDIYIFLFYEVLYKREPQVLQRSFTTVQVCIFRAVPSKTHNK